MMFDKSDSVWRCSHNDCRVIARRKDEDFNPASEPQKFVTTLEIIMDSEGEETYLLNVYSGGTVSVLDVTENVDMVIDEQTNSVTLCLLFHNVKRVYL